MTIFDGRRTHAFRTAFGAVTRVLALTSMLTSCGGGSGVTGTTPSADPPSFIMAGPQVTGPVQFLCGSSDGDAGNARYLRAYYGAQPPNLKLTALPDGGLIGRTATDNFSSATRVDILINRLGQRTRYTARNVDAFRVDTEGKLWWIDEQKTLWRGALNPDGKDESIGLAAPYTGSPNDGAANAAPLGAVKGFAANRQAVYLLVQDSAASRLALRRLVQATTGWQVSTIAIPESVAGSGFDAKVLTNSKGTVALVTTSPTETPADLMFTSYARPVNVTYWRLRTDASWESLAVKTYTLTTNGQYGSNTLELESVTLDNNDDLIWGGGGAARIYSMGPDGSWRTLAKPDTTNSAGIGLNGSIADQATFLSAYNVLTDSEGNIVFYDDVTCQIRKLSNQTLSTLSGPSYGEPRAHFSSARLLGIDAQGALLFARDPGFSSGLPTPLSARYDLATESTSVIDGPGILVTRGTVETQSGDACSWSFQYGRACASYTWRLTMPDAALFTGMDQASSMPYVFSGSQLFRRSSNGYQAVTSVPDAGLVGGAYDFPYVVGHTTDTNYQPVLYRFNGATNSFEAIAGPTIDTSPLFPGKRTALNNEQVKFVQHRSDGGFWMASATFIGRITSSGDWVGVAGTSSGLPQSIDGTGSSAAFSKIKRLRTLRDDRLLVLDDNAVRLVEDSGVVRTLFTLKDTKLAGSNFFDMLPVGRDIYLTTDDQPQMIRAKNWLP